MWNRKNHPLLCFLLFLLCPDCTSPNPTYDPCAASGGSCPGAPPSSPPSTFALLTPMLSKQQGGMLEFTLPLQEIAPPVVLNQPSGTESYVLAKLVQPGIASLDLNLQPGKEPGHFVASVVAQDLASFQKGSLTLQVSTSVTMHTNPVDLQ